MPLKQTSLNSNNITLINKNSDVQDAGSHLKYDHEVYIIEDDFVGNTSKLVASNEEKENVPMESSSKKLDDYFTSNNSPDNVVEIDDVAVVSSLPGKNANESVSIIIDISDENSPNCTLGKHDIAKKLPLLTPKRKRLSSGERLARKIIKEDKQRELLLKKQQLESEREKKQQQRQKELDERSVKRKLEEYEKAEKLKHREESKRLKDSHKEEEKRLKEDERIKREATRKREEIENQKRLQKQQSTFGSFFLQKEKQLPCVKISESVAESIMIDLVDEGSVVSSAFRFNSIPLRGDTRLATFNALTEDEIKMTCSNIDVLIRDGNDNLSGVTYLRELSDDYVPKRRGSTWPFVFPQNDIEIITKDEHVCKEWVRRKLLQFTEDVRPPYCGSWSKVSDKVTGRRPFRKDSAFLDYSLDSEENWEAEAEGESITKSNGDDEDHEMDGDGDDNGETDAFVVPHGYLSDDEGLSDDVEEADVQNNVITNNQDDAVQLRKIRQKISQQEFEASMKRAVVPLRRKVAGPYSFNVLKSDANCVSVTEADIRSIIENDFKDDSAELENFMASRMFLWSDEVPIKISFKKSEICNDSQSRHKRLVPKEAYPFLIRLIHTNNLSRKKINFEFRMFWEKHYNGCLPGITYENDCKGKDWDSFSISKASLNKAISSLAKYVDGRWCVTDETFVDHNLNKEEFDTTWDYVTNLGKNKKMDVIAISSVSQNLLLQQCSLPSVPQHNNNYNSGVGISSHSSTSAEKGLIPITNYISSTNINL